MAMVSEKLSPVSSFTVIYNYIQFKTIMVSFQQQLALLHLRAQALLLNTVTENDQRHLFSRYSFTVKWDKIFLGSAICHDDA